MTPLDQKVKELPRSIVFKRDILPQLEEHGVSMRTFQRDRKELPGNIPTRRLNLYAALFSTTVAELMEGYSKIRVKSLVRKSLGKKVGLKS